MYLHKARRPCSSLAATLVAAADGRGMFGFFEDHRAYIEVLTYEKVLDDAQKRNRILFEKLRLS
jgi:hypothetical protein